MEIVIMVFQVIGIIIGILIVLFVLELAIVAFVPGFSVPKQRLEKEKEIPEDVEKNLLGQEKM